MLVVLRMLAPLLCAAWLLAAAAAGQRVRVCGSDLANTLALVCRDRGGFNGPPNLSLGGGSRTGRGVVDECCYLGCTLQTMQMYCKFDHVVKPRMAHPDDDEEEDEHFSFHLLHGQEAWCEDLWPARRALPSGDVECAYSSSCPANAQSNDLRLEDVVRKGRKPSPP